MASQEAFEYVRIFADAVIKIDERLTVITTANFSATGLLLFTCYNSDRFPRWLAATLSILMAIFCSIIAARYTYFFGINEDGRMASLRAWVDGATSPADVHKAVMAHPVARKAFEPICESWFRWGEHVWVNWLPIAAWPISYLPDLWKWIITR